MTFRWMQVIAFAVAFAFPLAAQEAPKQDASTPSASAEAPSPNGNNDLNVRPDDQDANHQSSAINTTNDLARSQSAMQASAPSARNIKDADSRLAAQTSPRHEVRYSVWILLWIGVIAAVLLILAASRPPRRLGVVRRRNAIFEREGMDGRDIVGRGDVISRREVVDPRNHDVHRAA